MSSQREKVRIIKRVKVREDRLVSLTGLSDQPGEEPVRPVRMPERPPEDPTVLLAALRQRLGQEAVELVDEVVRAELADFRQAMIRQVEREAKRLMAQGEVELRRAREEAEAILRHAREEAEKLRQQAEGEVRRRAKEAAEQARARVEGEIRQRCEEVVRKFEGLPRVLEEKLKQEVEELEPDLVELALAVGRVLAEHELSLDPSPVRKAILEHLRLIEGESHISIRIAPRLMRRLEEAGELELLRTELKNRGNGVEIRADESLEGGYLIETPRVSIDHCWGRVMEEIRRVLGQGAGGRQEDTGADREAQGEA